MSLVTSNGRQWEVVIGLETHAQLHTESKQFSGAATRFGAEPNRQACPVDLALPGVLPVLNRASVECAIKFGLAIGAQIAPQSIFARKNYFYPDLPKGYQISQYEIPVVAGGRVAIAFEANGQLVEKTIQLTRAHLEEDAGKSLHEDFAGMSGIDLNRAGTPLLEIVTEPDMRSAKEAVAYARTLHGLVTWLNICDGNMQEGSFRCDANVSVRPVGQAEYGTRCEIKNLNSFRFLERAIEHEVQRQITLIEDGGTVVQETRLYDPERDETRSMRSKEDAHDYRYFPDPDLPPLRISAEEIERVRASLPELPASMQKRFTEQLGLTPYDATLLTQSREMADYFQAVSTESGQPKLAANWVMGEVARRLNADGIELSESPVNSGMLGHLIKRIHDGTISNNAAKQIFDSLYKREAGGQMAEIGFGSSVASTASIIDQLIEAKGLKQMSDTGALEKIVEEVIAAQPSVVAEYKSGKEKAFNALVGQVMKASKGKANPAIAGELLKRKLAE